MTHNSTTYTTVRFGDVARQVTESTHSPIEDGFERYTGMEHLESESLKIRQWGLIEGNSTTFTRVFRAGQVLFGRRRAYQRKAALADFDGICSGDIIVMEAKPNKLLPDLLPFIVQTEGFYEYALSTSAGSLSPRTKWSALAKYEFPLPPLDEQRRIADVLWAVEDAIESFRFFVDQLLKTRIIVFEELVRQHDVDHNCITKFRNALIDIIAGKSPEGASRPAEQDEYGVLKVSAIGDYSYHEEENKVLVSQSDFLSAYEVQKGFLLVTRANASKSGVARACLVESTRAGLMLSDKTLRLILHPEHATYRYMLEALRGRSFRNYIEMEANGTEAKNISQAKLRNAPIPLLPLKSQKSIEQFLYQYDESLKTSEIHASKLKLLKQTLLNGITERSL